jgi:cytochrome P450
VNSTRVGEVERPQIEGFEPLSPEFLRDPYIFFERARREAPVFFHPGPPAPFWVLTRYDDCLRVLSDPEAFSSRVLGNVEIPEQYRDQLPDDYFKHIVKALDPPEHTPVRKLLQKGFRRPRMLAMEDEVQQRADALVDDLLPRGGCDLMKDFAKPMTLLTLLGHLGLPDDDLDAVVQLGDDLLALFTDGVNPMEPEVRAATWERFMAIGGQYERIAAERAELPDDEDTLAMLAHTTGEDGCPVRSHQQLGLDIIVLLTAGMDTTANLICEVVKLLEDNPDQREELRADPSLIPQAVEEGLRWRGSSMGQMRLTTQEVEIGGHPVPAGSLVWAALASANHDEDRFPDPRRFDIHRENATEHLGFGKGTHFCVGAPLGRLEARIAIETLLERIPSLRVPSQEIQYVPSLGVTVNLVGMQVEWDG